MNGFDCVSPYICSRRFFLCYVATIFYLPISLGPGLVLIAAQPLPPIYGGMISTFILGVVSHVLLRQRLGGVPQAHVHGLVQNVIGCVCLIYFLILVA